MSTKPLSIGVVGAGGIGSYYAGLAANGGHQVTLLARGDHLKAIRTNGLEVSRPGEKFVTQLNATDDGNALRGLEYIIVAVKTYSLAEVGATVAEAAKSGATVVPLLNGVDVAERLEALGVPHNSLVGGLTSVSVFRTAPGKVERRSPFDRLIVGELNRSKSERTQRLVDALNAEGVTAKVSDDIGLDLWRKYAFILPMNVASGLTRGPVGDMLAIEGGRTLLSNVVSEIAAVSRVAGTALDTQEEAKAQAAILALPPATTPSFLADLERGGPTELEALVANISRLGKLHGVPTPVHDVATVAFEAATKRKS
ncbi:MAG: ketopantoate reductase family protein [Gemmatimonadaceae bacterium]